ncbi:MAG: hypothetical protein ACI8Y4_003842 [Candidatus Poriferisodalaceae bacterium]|jgi:hypothetical protein
MRRNEVVPEDSLIGALWPTEELPENPRRSLQTYTSRLRAMIGPELILTEVPGYRLTADTDAVRFQQAVLDGRTRGRSSVGARHVAGRSVWGFRRGRGARRSPTCATNRCRLPDRERASRVAMLALCRSGRQPDALRVFQSHRLAGCGKLGSGRVLGRWWGRCSWLAVVSAGWPVVLGWPAGPASTPPGGFHAAAASMEPILMRL